MSEELKPCPFCGSEAKVDDIIGRYAYCPNADCHLWRLEGEEIEIDEWQSRPIEYALRKQLDMAVEALEKIKRAWTDNGSMHLYEAMKEASDALSEINRIGGMNVQG